MLDVILNAQTGRMYDYYTGEIYSDSLEELRSLPINQTFVSRFEGMTIRILLSTPESIDDFNRALFQFRIVKEIIKS